MTAKILLNLKKAELSYLIKKWIQIKDISKKPWHLCDMINWSRGRSFMLFSTCCYAGLNLCVKQLHHIPPVEMLFFRSLISFAICAVGIYQAGVSLFGNNKKWLIIRGCAGILALWLYFTCLQKIPLASAVAIQYTSPVFTALFASFILGEKMNKWKWVFFLVSMVGVGFIKGFDPRLSLSFTLIGLASALFSGLAYTSVRKLHATENPFVIIIYFPMLALPITGIYSYLNWVSPIGTDWFFILAMGILTQFGQFSATQAIQMERLENVTFLNYFGIILALGLGFFLFQETFDAVSLSGMGLVLGGIFLNLVDKEKMKARRPAFLKSRMK